MAGGHGWCARCRAWLLLHDWTDELRWLCEECYRKIADGVLKREQKK